MITANLVAGSGGCEGGTNCSDDHQKWGAGGGAGGSIVLQAATIVNTAIIAGDGASEGSTGNPNGPGAHGNPGENGQPSTNGAARGDDQGDHSASVGAGGAATPPPVAGTDFTQGQRNGSGGRGAVGRIVFATDTADVGGTVSPPGMYIAF